MYKPRHFKTQELVPRHVYDDRGEKSLELLDDRLLITIDKLRDAYGPIIINDWHKGGKNQWRGLRTEQSPYGTIYSQHRFGRAADLTFLKTDAETVRLAVLDSPDRFPLIQSLELDVSWFHLDIRNCERIKTYSA